MNFQWRPPSPELTAWMEGWSHRHPSVLNYDFGYVDDRRRQAFFKACRTGNPDLAVWPEFSRELDKLKLKKAYDRGTISLEVAGLLIAQQNRSVGGWFARAERMRRAGKDPLRRRRYVRATRQLYTAIAQARKIAELRQFEMVARRQHDIA